MAKKLYVGNLPYSMTDDLLRDLFAEAGNIDSATVITDRDSGRSKGFGFVEMPNDDDAKRAIEDLDGVEIEGKTIVVKIAKPREEGGRPRNQGRSNKRY